MSTSINEKTQKTLSMSTNENGNQRKNALVSTNENTISQKTFFVSTRLDKYIYYGETFYNRRIIFSPIVGKISRHSSEKFFAIRRKNLVLFVSMGYTKGSIYEVRFPNEKIQKKDCR